MPARPHHDGSVLHTTAVAPALDETVILRLRIPEHFGTVADVQLRSVVDHEPRYTRAMLVGAADGWGWWEVPLLAENPVIRYRWLVVQGDGEHLWLTADGCTRQEPRDNDDFRLAAGTDIPEWSTEAVLYQLFPDRFARSVAADERELPEWAEHAEWTDTVIDRGPSIGRQFFGGDLDGITEHLDHLERLGINLLYLTPVFPARSNHRYDALSFDEVDPLLGGDEAYIRLIEAAHARGIRVMGDLTTNHSGDAHEWFTRSHLQPGTPESEFYYWLDPEQRTYVSWLGHSSLPKFNWNSSELRDRFIEGPDSVVGKWLRPPFSLDGWRIDVANMTGRYFDEDHNVDVRRTIRTTMREIEPETLLLGEYTADASPDFQGDAWHGAMTYPGFTRPVLEWLSVPGSPSSYFGIPYGTIPDRTGVDFYETHRRFTAGFPWQVRLASMNALDTHDIPRFATHAREGAVPVALGLSMTLPGIPVVWMGDEIGALGENGEDSRRPMPWDTLEDAAERIDLYARMIRLRRSNPALREGGIRWLHVSDDALAFVRETAVESALVLATRTHAVIDLEDGALTGAPERLEGPGIATGNGSGYRLTTDGISFTVWTLPGVVIPQAVLDETIEDLAPTDIAGHPGSMPGSK
ncbi:glycoside hydrolase family 13 protein [Naasia lichenicola]|uniref:Glycoside hydrolase family 13 protein n=1 Tax=Naasia lichenicola TaxID=2565933 RepID=A0A4S4FP85_9MICO|nr:glycoside hydrolase family 13 protein [Naasia lichenicola]